MGNKLINSATKNDRYRVFINDGQYSNSFSMLATQLNERVTNGEIEQFTIVRLNNYVCNDLNGKKVIIITDLDILEKGKNVGKKIGDPIQINADGSVNSTAPNAATNGKRKAEEVKESAAKRSPFSKLSRLLPAIISKKIGFYLKD